MKHNLEKYKKRVEIIKQLNHLITKKVEESLGVNLNQIYHNLLSSYNPEQQKAEKFFRDLYNIETPRKGLLQILEAYIRSKVPYQTIDDFVADPKTLKRFATEVKEEFQAKYRAGEYQTEILPRGARKEAEELINNLKDPREKKILKLYYGFTPDRKSYALREIGKMFGVVHERIRQIKNKALRRIRKAGGEELAEKYSSVAYKLKLKLLRKIQRQALLAKIDELSDILEKALISKKPVIENNYLDEPINTLKDKLSVRAYNSLLRGGYTTIRDIKNNQRSLLKIRNIGRKSFNEIKEVLSTLGVEIEINYHS